MKLLRTLKNSHCLATVFLTLLVTTGINKSPAYGNSDRKKDFRIVVLHSYDAAYVAYPDFNKLIRKGFEKEKIHADLRTFYLDCAHYGEADENQRMYHYIDSISTWKPDLILANEDQATYALLACGHPFVRTVPIVFTGVNFPNWGLLEKYTEITGFWDRPDYLETIRMIEKLLGKTQIRFLHDNGFLGKKVTQEMAEQLRTEYPDISKNLFNHLTRIGSSLLDSANRIFTEDSALDHERPAETILKFMNLGQQKSANGFLWMLNGMTRHSVFVQTKYDYAAMRIGRIAAIPTFTVLNKGFNYSQGTLGGYLTTVDIQAAEGTARAARILKGEKASEIPITQSQKKHVIDWHELNRWNISPDSIPANYEIINIPFSERYQKSIISVGVIVLILTLSLITYLSFLYSRENKRKKEAQINLQREKDFLLLALEGSNIFAWKYNLEKNIFFFDKEFFDTVGITPQVFSREQVWNIVHPDEFPEVAEQFRKVKDKEQNRATVDCRCNFSGKGYTWYEFRYIYVPDSDSIIGLILNIQDYKNREMELTEARDLAAQAELKQSFLANISHEIRTPLNAIVGFSGLLTGNHEPSPEEKNEFINIINRNCELLLKLIEDVLEISRIESDNIHFAPQEFNLNKLMEEIYSTHRIMMPDQVELEKDLPATSAFLHTDRHRLTQVITNLINNARKFTASGYIRIGYHTDETHNKVVIYVKDTGTGIPAKEQKMIFERFYKRNEFTQGTGLGLSICNAIVRKMGGEIQLQSTEGEGSQFTVILPCKS